MKTFQTAETAKILKPIINEKSVEFLKAEPESVYDLLLQGKLRPYSARLVELTLRAGAVEQIEQNGFDETALVPFIENECGLRKTVATAVVSMYATLFGGEHLAELRAKELQGFEEFCSKASKLKVEVNTAWVCDSGEVGCHCKASAEVIVVDKEILRNVLADELKKNPYLKAEDIREMLEGILNEKIEDDFENFVTAEEYYEPLAEEYDGNFSDKLDDFCNETGLKAESYDFKGKTDEFLSYYA